MKINLKEHKIPCLVCSCEKTKDVAFHMLTSLFKYDHENKLSIYIGCDISSLKPNFNYQYLETPQNNWKAETISQLEKIKDMNPNMTHILLLLDDFIVSSNIDIISLSKLQIEVEKYKIKYLMLKPTDDCFFNKILDYLNSFSFVNAIRVYKIRKSHPYYFSLQASFWDIDYLIQNIKESDNIWSFENLKYKNENHLAVIKPVIKYKHIVEKGEWDFRAKSICLKTIGFFKPGLRRNREISFFIFISVFFKKLSFFLLGYSIMQLKRNFKF